MRCASGEDGQHQAEPAQRLTLQQESPSVMAEPVQRLTLQQEAPSVMAEPVQRLTLQQESPSVMTEPAQRLTLQQGSPAVMAEPAQRLTLQQVIFNPGQFLRGPDVTVSGTVVVLDLDIQRMDISLDGAKLIVQLSNLDQASFERLKAGELVIGSMALVTGAVKKEQRRTFMEAHSLVQHD
eukprot:CAMPEP_0172743440 /NCGR_PEP_ID=MMETSP1074-20121228/132255_1 /TAXON_ID=2916 /ORGANISM="Ceratium fusus, Strain PA161109" /LENGTH=180 /DNA_ID=CAMNT_0013574165 /DNA_START=167 /DNA_END=709 /DNA_ORIENTATION=+